MRSSDLALLAMGSTLTLLAVACAYFILLEVVQFVRELRGSRSWRTARRRGSSQSTPRSGDTGPLKRGRYDAPAMVPNRMAPTSIHPMRDEAVVRQLIEHLKDDNGSDS